MHGFKIVIIFDWTNTFSLDIVLGGNLTLLGGILRSDQLRPSHFDLLIARIEVYPMLYFAIIYFYL